jgi:diguanylate cyclase (GGDEF)-like protein
MRSKLHSILESPTEYQNHLVVLLAIFSMPVLLFFTIFEIFIDKEITEGLVNLVNLIIFVILFILRIRQFERKWLYRIGAATITINFVSGVFYSPALFSNIVWIFVLPLPFVLLFGLRVGLVWMTITGIFSIVGILYNPHLSEGSLFGFIFSFFMSFSIQCVVASLSENVRRRGFEQAVAAQDTLQSQLQEIEVLQTELEHQLTIDSLTGLYNRRLLDDVLERELARAKRKGHPVCLVLVDIDNFKSVNDTHGHQTGDLILIEMAKLIKTNIRKSDVGCRWGGDEFIMLFPECTIQDAHRRTQEFSKKIMNTEFVSHGERIYLTLSIGLACYPDHAQTAEQMLRAADHAMYSAKSNQNQIIVVSNVKD